MTCNDTPGNVVSNKFNSKNLCSLYSCKTP